MAATEALRFRHLAPEDAPAGLALSTEAGWNQTEADWRFMLAEGEAFGFEAGSWEAGGGLVASALVLPFEGAEDGALAWISMVLVTAAWRRRGLATRLMRHAVDRCEARKLTPLLDATPEGAAVYGRLGFEAVRAMTRWRAETPKAGSPRFAPPDPARIVELDAAIMGCRRPALIHHLAARAGCRGGMGDRGFVLARDGRTADEIGPLVAGSDDEAVALLDHALAAGGAVIVDAFDDRDAFADALAARGFVRQRAFLRMVRGAMPPTKEDPQRLYAAAGPELG